MFLSMPSSILKHYHACLRRFSNIAQCGCQNSKKLEKRLQIDVLLVQESHDKDEVHTLAWITGAGNIADGLTKGLAKDSHLLWKKVTTTKMHVLPHGCVNNL